MIAERRSYDTNHEDGDGPHSAHLPALRCTKCGSRMCEIDIVHRMNSKHQLIKTVNDGQSQSIVHLLTSYNAGLNVIAEFM